MLCYDVVYRRERVGTMTLTLGVRPSFVVPLEQSGVMVNRHQAPNTAAVAYIPHIRHAPTRNNLAREAVINTTLPTQRSRTSQHLPGAPCELCMSMYEVIATRTAERRKVKSHARYQALYVAFSEFLVR